jgi:endonuclease/exonuclease/phosphatase family metal-dependent hydrolase
MRIASYNIRAGLGTDLRRDAGRAVAMIKALDADIVALQEADFRLGARPAALPPALITSRTGLVPISLGGDPSSLGWHGIALLARPNIVTQEIRRFDLPGLEPRGAIVVDVQTGLGPLRIVGVHLGLLRRSRRLQLSFLRTTLADLAPLPTLILGDFNEWSVKRGLGRLARDFTIQTPHRTFPSSLPVFALDRIAHSASLDIRFLPPPRPQKGAHASDHLPILAEVKHAH